MAVSIDVKRLKYEMVVISVFAIIALAGCEISRNKEAGFAHVETVIHYGRGIGISNMYVNGLWVGSEGGWGGGGGSICCISLPLERKKETLIEVKWETCDIRHIGYLNGKSVDSSLRCRRRWHEATVPIHFAELVPGNHFGLIVHVLPGHKVEAWTSDKGIRHPEYPGPKYPSGPAPKYTPLPGEYSEDKLGN